MGAPVQVCWQKRIDNSRLVRQRAPGYARECGALLAGALVCLAVVLLCAWQYFEYVQTGYRLEELRARHEQVLEWNRSLRLEHATLTDPMRIDALARNRLGLEIPQAGQMILLGTGAPRTPVPVWARVRSVGQAAQPVSLTD